MCISKKFFKRFAIISSVAITVVLGSTNQLEDGLDKPGAADRSPVNDQLATVSTKQLDLPIMYEFEVKGLSDADTLHPGCKLGGWGIVYDFDDHITLAGDDTENPVREHSGKYIVETRLPVLAMKKLREMMDGFEKNNQLVKNSFREHTMYRLRINAGPLKKELQQPKNALLDASDSQQPVEKELDERQLIKKELKSLKNMSRHFTFKVKGDGYVVADGTHPDLLKVNGKLTDKYQSHEAHIQPIEMTNHTCECNRECLPKQKHWICGGLSCFSLWLLLMIFFGFNTEAMNEAHKAHIERGTPHVSFPTTFDTKKVLEILRNEDITFDFDGRFGLECIQYFPDENADRKQLCETVIGNRSRNGDRNLALVQCILENKRKILRTMERNSKLTGKDNSSESSALAIGNDGFQAEDCHDD